MTLSTHRLTVAGLGLAALLTLSACGNGDSGSHGRDGMGHGGSGSSATSSSSSSPSSTAAMGDVGFAQMMIPHHEQAVEMADQALGKGTSAPVAQLARDIKAAQAPEIATMQGWLREWGAPAMPSGGDHSGHGGGMMSDADMDELAAAQGAEFERLWLTMMIEHHEGAVDMAEDVLETTSNPEVERLAQAIVKAQNEEIAVMKGLL